MDFFNQLDYMMLVKAFVVGGLICIVGQILLDKTKLTSARILVLFVTAGVILGGLRNIPTLNRLRWRRSKCPTNRIRQSTSQRRHRRSNRKRPTRSLHRWPKSLRRRHSRRHLLRLPRIPSRQTKNKKAIGDVSQWGILPHWGHIYTPNNTKRDVLKPHIIIIVSF